MSSILPHSHLRWGEKRPQKEADLYFYISKSWPAGQKMGRQTYRAQRKTVAFPFFSFFFWFAFSIFFYFVFVLARWIYYGRGSNFSVLDRTVSHVTFFRAWLFFYNRTRMRHTVDSELLVVSYRWLLCLHIFPLFFWSWPSKMVDSSLRRIQVWKTKRNKKKGRHIRFKQQV